MLKLFFCTTLLIVGVNSVNAASFKNRSECLQALGTDGAITCFNQFPDRPKTQHKFKSREECLNKLGTEGAMKCFQQFPEKKRALKFKNRSECMQRLGTDGAIQCMNQYPN